MGYPTMKFEVDFTDDPTATYQDMVPARAVAWFRMNESGGTTYADSSGTGNTGTNASTIVQATPGALPGDTDKATTSPQLSINGGGGLLGQDCTMIWWFRYTGITTSNVWTFRDITVINTGKKLVQISRLTGNITLTYQPTSGTVSKTWLGVWGGDQNWHMLAIVLRAGVPTMYYDGVEFVSGVSGMTATETAGGVVRVGHDATTANRFFGEMDEVSEHDTGFSRQYIQALYAARTNPVTPTWTDITAYVKAGTVQRGRQHETDTISAGTCSLVLDNTDGRFDPANTGSPYYPNVLPMRRVRVTATYAATPRVIFKGFVERWPPVWYDPGDAEVTITCVDGFEPLAVTDLSGNTYTAETSGARITKALNAAFWPAADRNLDTGTYTVAAATFNDGSGQTALTHIQQVAVSDLGYFFIDAQGRATFHGAGHRSAAAVQATFGDAAGELPYEGVAPDFSRDLLANDVTVSRGAGTPQRTTDATSIRQFFARTRPVSTVLNTDADALTQATSILTRYKDPALRIEQVTLAPDRITGTDGDNLWAQVLDREIGDALLFRKRPVYGTTVELVEFVEQVAHTFGPDMRWTTTWQLSPYRQSVADRWLLGDPLLSVLGTTTTPT